MGRLKFAMVCASNFNRSMEAHGVLKSAGLDVRSYGVSSQVKLPGPSASQPNVYPFGTPYEAIHADLLAKDQALYTRNGLLQMVTRNIGIKSAPERWQDSSHVFDVVVTFEDHVFEKLVEDLHSRQPAKSKPALVVNIDVKDSQEEAALAAPQALRLCQLLEAAEEWEDELEQVVDSFQAETGRRPTYTICFY